MRVQYVVQSFDLKDGRHIAFPSLILRVWKKEAGQWKIAAMFAMPHYHEPSPAAQE